MSVVVVELLVVLYVYGKQSSKSPGMFGYTKNMSTLLYFLLCEPSLLKHLIFSVLSLFHVGILWKVSMIL
jgi:hypothetical protein